MTHAGRFGASTLSRKLLFRYHYNRPEPTLAVLSPHIRQHHRDLSSAFKNIDDSAVAVKLGY